MGEFFAALPDAFRAFWEFGGGFVGVLLMGGSIVLIALFCGLAYQLRNRLGWTSALFGSMAVLLALWWLIGIIPSAWVYFADSQKDLLAGRIIPEAITIGRLELATNFYNVFRDSIVMIEGAIVLGIGVAVMLAVQKRFPKGLAEGEERGPTTGGYK
jgi:multisubunit Na+/H+ antiporter MnhB subunit